MVTPKDIQVKQFGLSMRGYNKREVDEFLDAITIDYQNLIEEKSRLEQENKDLKSRLEESQKNEHSVMNTLEQAKRLMSDISESAEKRAEVIIKNAHLDAQTITRNAKDSVATYTEQSEQMKNKLAGFRSRFKQFLNDEMGRMDSTVEELFADLGEIVPDMDELDRRNTENYGRQGGEAPLSSEQSSFTGPSSRQSSSSGGMDETRVFSVSGEGQNPAARSREQNADHTMVFGRDELKNASDQEDHAESSAGSGSYEKYSLEDLFKDDGSSSSDQTMVFSKDKVTDEFGSEQPVMEGGRKTDASRAASNEPDTSWLKDAPDETAAKKTQPGRRPFSGKGETVVMDKNDFLKEFDKHK
ncbi:MAG: DivIVA domain-containing protein [Eubacterium sp.]